MLRPVDMQQIITQVSSVEKVQHLKQQQPETEHRHFALQLEEEDVRNRNAVKESQETKETEIRDDDKDKKRKREQKRLKCADSEKINLETVHKPPEVYEGNIVDIIV